MKKSIIGLSAFLASATLGLPANATDVWAMKIAAYQTTAPPDWDDSAPIYFCQTADDCTLQQQTGTHLLPQALVPIAEIAYNYKVIDVYTADGGFDVYAGYVGPPRPGMSGSSSNGNWSINTLWIMPLGHLSQLTPLQKQGFQTLADAMGLLGKAALAAAALPAPLPGNIRLPLAALGAAATDAQLAVQKLASDPADSNYTVIAQPGSLFIPNGLDKCQKPLMQATSDIYGNATAGSTSNDRMQGAIDGTDATWLANQGQAMLQYAAVVDNDRASYTAKWQCFPVYSKKAIAPSAIADIQTSIAANGPPSVWITGMTQEGFSQSDITAASNAFMAANPTMVATAYNAVFGPNAGRAAAWATLGF